MTPAYVSSSTTELLRFKYVLSRTESRLVITRSIYYYNVQCPRVWANNCFTFRRACDDNIVPVQQVDHVQTDPDEHVGRANIRQLNRKAFDTIFIFFFHSAAINRGKRWADKDSSTPDLQSLIITILLFYCLILVFPRDKSFSYSNRLWFIITHVYFGLAGHNYYYCSF